MPYYIIIIIVIIFLFIGEYGFNILNPTSKDWIVVSSGDIYQHYVGWEGYRVGSWKFPIGLTDTVSYPTDISVIYTDAVPIVAFIFKLISFMLPKTFQYFGLYGLLCFILNGVLSARIIKKYTDSKLIIILSSILFVVVPVLLSRVFYHTALGSQFLIILALSTIFLYREYDNNKRYLIWGIIAFLSSSIHIYYIPMCGIILLGYILLDILKSKKIFRGFILLVEYLVVSLFFVWLFGGFVNYVKSDTYGFGKYSFNLNGLVNSQGWSIFLKSMPINEAQYEGFSYLGMGVIILVLISIVLSIIWFIKDRENILKYKKVFVSLLFISVLSIFVALSPDAYIGRSLLYELHLPSFINDIWGVFRSTGRFVWPVVYLLMFVSIIILIKRLKYKYIIIIISICLFIQVIDIKNILLDRFYYYSYKVMVYNFKDMDNYVELNDVIKNKKVKYLILFGSSITDFDKENYSDWALNNGLKTNIMYFARNSFVDFIKNNTEKFLNEIDESKIYISSSKNECDRYNLYCYELPDGNYLGYVNEIE